MDGRRGDPSFQFVPCMASAVGACPVPFSEGGCNLPQGHCLGLGVPSFAPVWGLLLP